MTHLYLARHGETEENVAQILQGLMPGHLTARGREQAAELRDKLVAAHTAFDVMLTSDLQRALDTANIINGGLHLPLTPMPLAPRARLGEFYRHSHHHSPQQPDARRCRKRASHV